MKGLTKRQKEVLAFIRTELETVGRPPTLHEIKDHFGWVSSNAAWTHLMLLQEKGELTVDKHQARGIRLKHPPRTRATREVPLVGQVPAGIPAEAIENAEETIAIDPAMFSDENLFALRVTGDSMEGAGIHDGDIAIVQQQTSADAGKIVVARIDGEATVKRLKRKGRSFVLHPENPTYDDIPLRRDQDISICGVVVGIVRRVE